MVRVTICSGFIPFLLKPFRRSAHGSGWVDTISQAELVFGRKAIGEI